MSNVDDLIASLRTIAIRLTVPDPPPYIFVAGHQRTQRLIFARKTLAAMSFNEVTMLLSLRFSFHDELIPSLVDLKNDHGPPVALYATLVDIGRPNPGQYEPVLLDSTAWKDGIVGSILTIDVLKIAERGIASSEWANERGTTVKFA